MDKHELGAFLRSRRERLRPEDVGLPAGPRRRTPGLRREEVAVLAHISTEYYVRLEQGRAPRPSSEVLAGIAGALRLSDAEADHLHVLAGTAPTRIGLHRRDVQATPMLTKTFQHPVVGQITVDCDSLELTDSDQQLVLYTAPQGSRDAENLALLNVIGRERMSADRMP